MAAQNGIANKAAFRARLTGLRNALDEETRSEWSSAACRHLANVVEQGMYQSILVYVSFRSEIDLHDFIVWCWEKGLDVIVPRCNSKDRSMTLHRLSDWNELRTGSYGILEPDPTIASAVPQSFLPDLVVVPGLAFDLEGGRMGYGGGYYDRFAELLHAKSSSDDKGVIWLGAAFEAQLVPHVPSEAHDLRLDGVVTEKMVYFVHKQIE